MPLANPKAFFARVDDADLLGPVLTQNEVDGCNALLAALGRWPLAHAAYGLGTAYHETAGTMQPVKERGGPDYFRRMYDKTGARPQVAAALGNTEAGDGARFAGRGYPQLTGRRNYARADRELGLNGALLRDPDLAMRPDIAARIMEAGMREGWFTGRGLAAYLPSEGLGSRTAFISARRIINGTDRAEKIAHHAMDFQEALAAGGWSA